MIATLAYIGPGAGFALLTSVAGLLTTVVLALVSLAMWPVRWLWRRLTRAKRARPQIRRLVIVGFDGQDPGVTDRLLAAGRLPNFAKLARDGGYSRLKTTCPPLSPVAWSSFSTGANPGKHNIFDFVSRDRHTYSPTPSSTRLDRAHRVVRFGRFVVPLGRSNLQSLRRSKPFWSVLGEHGVWSTILRVPITFPPDRFHGAQLSAMATPDLRGTQGVFTLFTTRETDSQSDEAGARVPISVRDDRFEADLEGPDHPFARDARPLAVRVRGRLDRAAGSARIDVGESTVTIETGRLSAWITVRFRAAPGVSVSGICRLLVTEMDEHVSLYVTPINIDPDRPSMPISEPPYYSAYLAARIGKFATLGLAEDTGALNEGVVSDDVFLQQTYDIDRERQSMCLAALAQLRSGALVTVFDATDRVQHMFWRQLEGGDSTVIDALYEHNDAFVGRVIDRLGPDDVLMVISDHGFAPFRRGVSLNGWLHENGYLALKPGASGKRDWLQDVDWSRTRAYALGLTGLFLNLDGREGQGIVTAGLEANALKAELTSRLRGLIDPATREVAITDLFDAARVFSGPYTMDAPDFVVGYNRGYRHSWESARGIVAGETFTDNLKAWSGDHCIDPRLVPGVMFCNRPIAVPDASLIDIAPTVLQLFGVPPPSYMEGTPLFASGVDGGAAA